MLQTVTQSIFSTVIVFFLVICNSHGDQQPLALSVLKQHLGSQIKLISGKKLNFAPPINAPYSNPLKQAMNFTAMYSYTYIMNGNMSPLKNK